MGSGGSALSALGLAAFTAGVAGGFAGGTAPAFAVGGAGVLPSTGSAMCPLSDLSIKIMNRDSTRTKAQIIGYWVHALIFPNPLHVKANSQFGAFCFFGALLLLDARFRRSAGDAPNAAGLTEARTEQI
jgi:hypothetical protein